VRSGDRRNIKEINLPSIDDKFTLYQLFLEGWLNQLNITVIRYEGFTQCK
jgi:hypothetical protein